MSTPSDSPHPPRGRDAVVRALLDAGAEQFARRGPAASLREIAAAAGVGLRLVHRHFGSKLGLLDAVLADLADDAGRSVPHPGSPATALFARAEQQRTRIRIVAWLDLTGTATVVDPLVQAVAGERRDAAGRDAAIGAVALAYGWTIFGRQLATAFGFDAPRAARLPTRLAALTDRLLTEPLPPGPRRGPATVHGPAAAPSPAAGDSVPPRGADAVRSAIVDAAGRRFAAEGVDASLRSIAADAGVNLGLIHRHFGNKDDLVAAVLQAQQAPAVARLAAAPTLVDAVDALGAGSTTGGYYSRILAFILLSGLPAERFQDSYPAIAIMRRLTSGDDQDDGLLAALALGHGLTTFGPTLARSTADSLAPQPARPPGHEWLAAARRMLVAG